MSDYFSTHNCANDFAKEGSAGNLTIEMSSSRNSSEKTPPFSVTVDEDNSISETICTDKIIVKNKTDPISSSGKDFQTSLDADAKKENKELIRPMYFKGDPEYAEMEEFSKNYNGDLPILAYDEYLALKESLNSSSNVQNQSQAYMTTNKYVPEKHLIKNNNPTTEVSQISSAESSSPPSTKEEVVPCIHIDVQDSEEKLVDTTSHFFENNQEIQELNDLNNDMKRAQAIYNTRPQSLDPFMSSLTRLFDNDQAQSELPIFQPKMEKNTNESKPMETAKKFKKLCHPFTVGTRLYVYNGKYYQYYSDIDAYRLILGVCRKEIDAKGSPSYVKAVYDSLMYEPDIAKPELPIDTQAISFENGVLLLKNMQLVPHNPQWMTTYGLQCRYLPNTCCPFFDKFLLNTSQGDMELLTRFYQAIGCILTPSISKMPFFVLQGAHNSGKSVLANFLRNLFNQEAIIYLSSHSLDREFNMSEMEDKALCISPDMSESALNSTVVSRVKQLIGGDYIAAERKNKSMTQFVNRARLVMVTNHSILTKGAEDSAFFDRAVVLPFNNSTPKEFQDPFLLDKMLAEKDAIATKSIQTYMDMRRQHKNFAGDYVLNAGTLKAPVGNALVADLHSLVYQFVNTQFVRDETAKVFLDDAETFFVKLYGVSLSNSFAKLFKRYVYECFGIEKSRMYKPGHTNAQSSYIGIRMLNN